MEIWQTFLLAFGGNAVLLVILGWLAKSIVTNLIAKDLKGFKNELKLKTIEHQSKFQGLHEKRAQVLAEFYKAIIAFDMYFKEHAHLTNQQLTTDEELLHSKEIALRYERLEKVFTENRIYFDIKTCELFDRLIESLKEIKELGITMKMELITEGTRQAIRIPSYQGIAEKIDSVKFQVENNFREILGSDV